MPQGHYKLMDEKWTGSEACTCKALLGFVCCNIYPGAYRRYCLALLMKIPASLGESGVGGIAAARMNLTPDCDLQIVVSTGPVAPSPNAEAAGRAAKKSPDRTAALLWMSAKPMGLLMLQRHVLECIRLAQTENFRIHANRFELAEQARAARAILAGRKELVVRDFPCLAFARGQVEEQCFQRGRWMLTGACYVLLPDDRCTVEFRGVAFSLVSRTMLSMFQMTTLERLRMPFPLYLLVAGNEVCRQIILDKPFCMWDEWSKAIYNEHPDLAGPVFEAKVLARMNKDRADNGISEVSFAAIRRSLIAKGVQCKRMEIGELNAEWLSMNERLGGSAMKTYVASKIKKKKTKPKKGPPLPKTPKTRHCGGAWRAFVREEASHMRADFTVLAAQYRELKRSGDPRYFRLVAEGREATKLRKQSRTPGKFKPWGVKPAVAQKKN